MREKVVFIAGEYAMSIMSKFFENKTCKEDLL